MRELPFFTPEINSLCYPFIHPYGETDFMNSSICLLVTQSTLTTEELEVSCAPNSLFHSISSSTQNQNEVNTYLGRPMTRRIDDWSGSSERSSVFRR